ncbi:MAG: glycosyltransferase, partial [Bacteroidota bacterium]
MKISVIIPTLNEQEFIGDTLRCLLERGNTGFLAEIIVIDSGSADQTVKIADSFKHCKTWVHLELKGQKYAILNKGASYASGKIFLFLDADTILPEGFDVAVREVIDEGYTGGAFEFALDGKGLALRFIEFVNRIRYRLGQRYYGDQAVFCTRQAFGHVGGYPA